MMMENSLPVRIETEFLNKPRLKFAYPRVAGLRNSRAQRQMNEAIQRLVNQLISETDYDRNQDVDITGTYELKTNERGVLSLAIINYWYSGGAHGMTVVKSLTFNVETGQSYTLAELFKPGSDYVRVISDQVRRQIEQRQIPLLTEYRGIAPNQDYYIADKSLVVYYQLYELAAYVYGILYFPISVYDLQSLINENGPLGNMLY
ncbi:uncharacterized protein DUF4163 [Hydrogenispora ethanolica]|uniref:Uncharacterized protein DUF4163 n=1 Tax=Hydrogenispora ethanolica TaxID=1082276 RepID=A0A4R1SBG9_HYDET|nr:uncharacterized protein DUF4163 [Hydrogenispora ethanolica]